MTKIKRNPYIKDRLSKAEIEQGKELIDYTGEGMPRIRAECASIPRPCPYVRCKYNLYLDVKDYTKQKTILLNFPHLDPTEMTHSCVLDEVDAHPAGMTLEEIGERFNLTRERVRQIEDMTLRRFRWWYYGHRDLRFQYLCDAWELSLALANQDGDDWDYLG